MLHGIKKAASSLTTVTQEFLSFFLILVSNPSSTTDFYMLIMLYRYLSISRVSTGHPSAMFSLQT